MAEVTTPGDDESDEEESLTSPELLDQSSLSALGRSLTTGKW